MPSITIYEMALRSSGKQQAYDLLNLLDGGTEASKFSLIEIDIKVMQSSTGNREYKVW
jgi:hypothetical protein